MAQHTSSHRKQGGNGSGTEVIPLLPDWLSCSEACERLGIGDRALRLAVQRGEVERRRIGRAVQFRIRRPLPTLPEAMPEAMPTTSDTGHLQRDLGEAIAIGMMLASERDDLRAEVARLREGLLDLALSPASVFLRRRILRLLAASNTRA